MKIYNKIILAIVFSITFSSCEDQLELSPVMDLSSENALNSTYGLQAGLIGVYDKLQGSYLYGGKIWAASDMLAGIVKQSGNRNVLFEELQLLNKTVSGESNAITIVYWQECFNTIHIINSVLSQLNQVNDPDMTDEVRDRIMGEAKFLRALIYFDMNRFYGYQVQGYDEKISVPILTEPGKVDEYPSRNTEDEVYNQIISDLNNAALLLEGKNINGRTTSIAAKALLSRVYFYKGDYASTIETATEVINNFSGLPNGGLEDNFLKCFTDSSSTEVLFAIKADDTDNASYTLRNYYSLGSSATFSFDGAYISKIGKHVLDGEDDARAKVDYSFINVKSQVYTTKYDLMAFDIPVIRLAEVYLNRAEARVHEGDLTGAADDLNIVRNRSGVSNITGTPTLADCETERTIELYMEGDYFHNMKRLKKENFAKDLNNNKYSWDDVKLVFPLPQNDLELNPNLIQNY